VSAIATVPVGTGYWLTDRHGNVYAFGDAVHVGGRNSAGPAEGGDEVVSLAPVPAAPRQR
jgi:hypothetical protein